MFKGTVYKLRFVNISLSQKNTKLRKVKVFDLMKDFNESVSLVKDNLRSVT